MSETPENEKETPEKTVGDEEEPQAETAGVDKKSAQEQEAADPVEDQPDAPPEKSAKAVETPAAEKEKPLDKMTVKELREIAKDIPGMSGVHAMKKDELITGIKEFRGIQDELPKKTTGTTRELKLKIKALKAERQAALEAKDKKKATIFRRRISRLKKKTRHIAA